MLFLLRLCFIKPPWELLYCRTAQSSSSRTGRTSGLPQSFSYQALEESAQRHYQALVDHLQLAYKRLPLDSTLRRALMGVDFAQLSQAFVAWAIPYIDLDESRWFAIDGKGLNGSITTPCDAHQQFVSLVSVFSRSQGVVVAMEQYRTHQGSEITVAKRLIAALDLQAVTG